jgi:hypothetical protein
MRETKEIKINKQWRSEITEFGPSGIVKRRKSNLS